MKRPESLSATHCKHEAKADMIASLQTQEASLHVVIPLRVGEELHCEVQLPRSAGSKIQLVLGELQRESLPKYAEAESLRMPVAFKPSPRPDLPTPAAMALREMRVRSEIAFVTRFVRYMMLSFSCPIPVQDLDNRTNISIRVYKSPDNAVASIAARIAEDIFFRCHDPSAK